MSILNLSVILHTLNLSGHIIRTVSFTDILSYSFIRLIRNTCGIGSQISYETNSAVSFNIHTFIQLLSDAHCFLCWKIQKFWCFLLQCTRCKRQRRFLRSLSVFNIVNFVWLTFKFRKNMFQLLLRPNIYLFLFFSIELCCQRLFFSFDIQKHF